MRYRYYIEKMQQTFSQWRGKIPKKEHTKYTHVKVLCIVCGALYPGGCLAILAKPEGDLSFGILHAVKVYRSNCIICHQSDRCRKNECKRIGLFKLFRDGSD